MDAVKDGGAARRRFPHGLPIARVAGSELVVAGCFGTPAKDGHFVPGGGEVAGELRADLARTDDEVAHGIS